MSLGRRPRQGPLQQLGPQRGPVRPQVPPKVHYSIIHSQVGGGVLLPIECCVYKSTGTVPFVGRRIKCLWKFHKSDKFRTGDLKEFIYIIFFCKFNIIENYKTNTCDEGVLIVLACHTLWSELHTRSPLVVSV